MKKIKRMVLFLLIIVLILLPMQIHAKTTTRYVTKKVSLYSSTKKSKKAVCKVKRNTKLKVISQNKTWARVKYKGKTLFIKKKWLHKQNSPKKYTGKYFRNRGRIHWRGTSWTWYTQRILPGYGLKIPGRHLDSQGFVCDKDDYIVLASSIGYKKQHKILSTPFGKFGKVYDTNGTWNYSWRDTYTNW